MRLAQRICGERVIHERAPAGRGGRDAVILGHNATHRVPAGRRFVRSTTQNQTYVGRLCVWVGGTGLGGKVIGTKCFRFKPRHPQVQTTLGPTLPKLVRRGIVWDDLFARVTRGTAAKVIHMFEKPYDGSDVTAACSLHTSQRRGPRGARAWENKSRW